MKIRKGLKPYLKRPVKKVGNINKNDIASKITVQAYAAVILCAVMLAVSRVDAKTTENICRTLKMAISQSISIEEAKQAFKSCADKAENLGDNIKYKLIDEQE